MDNIIECPKCKAKENGCDYCDYTGFIFSEGGKYYTVTLDASEKPIKGREISRENSSVITGPSLNFLFPKGEPHDLLWFYKKRKK